MKESDRATENLDSHLNLALEHLRNNWLNENVGFVSCVIEDHGQLVVATNTFIEPERLVHAERNAISIFEKKYGALSSESIVIVTLSPCVVFSKSRVGESCSSLLLQKGVKTIHFGLLHSKQGPINNYEGLGFTASETTNEETKKVCKKLLSLFEKYVTQLRIGTTSWQQLKEAVGYSIFEATQGN